MKTKFISHKQISKTSSLMRLRFEDSKVDVIFEMDNRQRDILYMYINREMNLERNVTFSSDVFEIHKHGKDVQKGTDFSVVLSESSDGILINLLGKRDGIDKTPSTLGVLKVLYNKDSNPEKWIR